MVREGTRAGFVVSALRTVHYVLNSRLFAQILFSAVEEDQWENILTEQVYVRADHRVTQSLS